MTSRGVQTQLTEERVRNMREWFSKISMDGEYAEVAVALADAYLAQQRVIEAARAAFNIDNGGPYIPKEYAHATGVIVRREAALEVVAAFAAVSVGSPETRETE